MPPNHFESEVGNFLEGSHGDRTHIKRADHHTVTPLCGTLLPGGGGAGRVLYRLSGGLVLVVVLRAVSGVNVAEVFAVVVSQAGESSPCSGKG